MKKNNTIIFICAYKDFVPSVSSDTYCVLDSNIIKPKTNLPSDDTFYAELFHYKYVLDNVELPKYVGFCHYSRYFGFMDDIPDMNKCFKECDCIVSTPMEFEITTREQYDRCHNIKDLEIVEGIIKKKYKSYSDACDKFLNGKIFVPCNMFIMKRSDFKKYCNFLFNVLDEYLKTVGRDIGEKNENHELHQYRLGRILGERITNIFLMKNFKKMKIYKTIKTDLPNN